jgi:hypothetical protein
VLSAGCRISETDLLFSTFVKSEIYFIILFSSTSDRFIWVITQAPKDSYDISDCAKMKWRGGRLSISIGDEYLITASFHKYNSCKYLSNEMEGKIVDRRELTVLNLISLSLLLSAHMNTTLWDIAFDVPVEDPTVVGGVLGWSAVRNATKFHSNPKVREQE